MTTLTRRRRTSSEDRDEDEETTPRRSRRSREEEPADEAPRSRRRSRDEEDEEDAAPSRRSRRSRDDSDEDDAPRRSAKPSSSRGSGRRTGGFGSYSQKRKTNSSFADEFKPDSGAPTLIKILDGEPFDVFNQHWVNEIKDGRRSFVCRDDEYFEEDAECPLDDYGDKASTFALFNIVDMTNPRKPEVKVWKTSVTVADKLERLSTSDKTSPLDREDLYFEVTMTKKKNKTDWDIQPVKSRDLSEDFDIDPFTAEELDDFDGEKFDDRTAITQVDSYDDLLAIAEKYFD